MSEKGKTDKKLLRVKGRKLDRETEKAMYVEIDLDPYGKLSKFIPKSIVKDGIIPSWFFEKIGLNIEVELEG